MAARDIYTEVSNRIIEDMVKGVLPWAKSWDGSKRGVSHLPMNATTGKPYRGINVLLLWLTATNMGYSADQRFLTFKQAKDAGGSVKKDEHGYPVYFFKRLEVKDNRSGADEDGTRSIGMYKQYTVFHVSQVDGCKLKGEPTNEAAAIPDDIAEYLAYLQINHTHGGDRACYIPSADRICMPYPQDFKTFDDYRATLYHETVHWTGAKHRLDRIMRTKAGSQDYAREELVAEMGGAFLCAEFGIPYQTQHAAYLADWLKVLKEDKRAIFQAASAAQKAVDFIRTAIEAANPVETQKAA